MPLRRYDFPFPINLCEDCQMLILHKSSPVRGQSTLLKVREHVEEMYGGDELYDGVA